MPLFLRKSLYFAVMITVQSKYMGLLFFVLFSFSSCSQEYSFEGKLTYITDDPVQQQITSDSAEYINYYVKQEKVRVETKTQMGKQIYIKDFKKNTAVLLLDFNGKKMALLQDLKKDTLQKNYSVKKNCKSTKVGEFKAKCLSISGEHLKEPVQVYYSKSYPGYMIDVYDKQIPGLPLQYDLIVQGDQVNYELVRLDEREIAAEMFSIPEEYEQLTMEEFLERLSPNN